MTDAKIKPQIWKKGQSGNPAGKPKGARNHATRAVLALLEDGVMEVTKAVLEAAKGGDLAACRLVLERIIPPSKERPLSIDLPDTSTALGCGDAANAILQGVAAGDLLPGEGVALSGIVEARRRAVETIDLESRIFALEGKSK